VIGFLIQMRISIGFTRCILCIFGTTRLLHLREIYRVTRAGGRFVLAFTPKEDMHAVASFPATVYRFYSIAETRKFFSEVGFNHVEIVREPVASRDTVFAVAHR